MKELPTDPDKLHELLKKLKDKEAKLEADLAIQEHPELEDGITAVVLAMSACRKADRKFKLAEKPPVPEREHIESLEAQVEYYRSKLDAAETALAERVEGSYLKIKRAQRAAHDTVKTTFETWRHTFDERGVDINSLLPGLANLLS